jgi:small subunit ribosomal protein S8
LVERTYIPKPFFTSGRSEEEEYLLKLGLDILLISLIAGVSLLVKEGYIASCEKVSLDGKDSLSISLKYINEAPAIREIKRISKPSLRRYSSSSDLPEVKNGLGMYVLSTNKGLMSDKDARSQNIGGEVICEVF